MDAETLKIILDLKEENVLLKRAFFDAAFMLKEKRVIIVPLPNLCEGKLLFSEITNLISPAIDLEPSLPIMDDDFKAISESIKHGGQPSFTGRCLSPEQVEAIKSIYISQNRELDDYFEHCVEARLLKKSL